MKVNVADVIAALDKRNGAWTKLELIELLMKLSLRENETEALRSVRS